MDPLNDMCDALVSINNILQRRKQKIDDNFIESFVNETMNSKKDLSNTNLQILTEENFHYAHLYNRSIDELPSNILYLNSKNNK